jgi:neutral ceramidase
MKKWLVGYGERIITPPLGAGLCGYGFYLDRKAENVLDDLKIRALYLANGEQALMLISCDVIGLTVEFSDQLRSEIAAVHGIPPSHILLASTHTHSGPVTQSLPGLGEIDSAYMKNVRNSIRSAAADAAHDLHESEFSFASEAIEPIGFNRRRKNFCGIDPVLKAGIFRTEREKIYLLSYACHPAVLGPGKNVSADWPGAWVRAVEKSGSRAVFFQGFCGDIDPLTSLNRWGRGTADDLFFYGDLLYRRLEKAEKFAVRQPERHLAAIEKRVALPLRVYGKREIGREADMFRKKFGQFPGGQRFAEEWRRQALQSFRAFKKSPWLRNIPILALAIGKMKVLGLPGEVFCEIGIKLQKIYQPLLPLGYTNGRIGYIPTSEAYRNTSD